MSPADPLASATLAALYVSQGHRTRAERVLDEVLQRDPFDGHALHLRDRLRVPSRAVLSIAVDELEMQLQWQGAPPGMHAVVLVVSVSGTMRRRVTSRPCNDAFGRWTLRHPWPRGTAIACLGRVTDEGFVTVATARPVSWASDSS